MSPARLVCSACLCAVAALLVFRGCDCGPITIYVNSDASTHFKDGGSGGGTTGGDDQFSWDGAIQFDAGTFGAESPDAVYADAGDLDTCYAGAEDCTGGDAIVEDGGVTDGGVDSDTGIPCTPGTPLTGSISPMNRPSEITYQETVQVTYKGISLPGGTCNLMYFDAGGSVNRMELCYTLPFGYEIPVSEGELVTLAFVQQTIGEGVNQKIYVWDQDQVLRFFAYNGDPGAFDPVECADPKECPVPSFAASDCTPQTESCGKAIHPPVSFFMGGGACDRVVQQGEAQAYLGPDASCPPITRGKLVAALSMKMTENSCLDYPDAWLSPLVLNNSKVSQCLCRDHHDCAEGDVCETEAGRCVTAKVPEVPCEAGKVPDPYTGSCFLPYDQSNVPCSTTADCTAQNAGVCNTWWKESYGTGFCQKNPCEEIDCAWACAPLVGACYECLSDCGCYVPEQANKTCDLATYRCTP